MAQTDTTAPTPPQRLPCRGCTADCGNYATCEGKPWRATSAAEAGRK